MGLTGTEAEQCSEAHLSDSHTLTTVLPFLHGPGMLPAAEMGPSKWSDTIAAGSVHAVLPSTPNSKMNFPNEESKSMLEIAKILKSGFC